MSLARHLARRIAVTGPISVADYMAECLLHPELGYYTNREVFGRAGDFTTAPEISQMFGELIGLSLAQGWLDQGAPTGVLAEVGPGRGTLMADALRATARVPGFQDALALHLVEASPRLRALQRQALGDRAATWLSALAELPEAPLFLIANEFLDALPIRQFVRCPEGWRERMIGLEGETLAFRLSPPLPPETLAHRCADTAPGEMVEVCPALAECVGAVAGRIARHGGLALFIDYGGWTSRGDTLQAVRNHLPADVLDAPGLADLTAHVDFAAVAAAARAAGAEVSAPVPQGVFLERLGITRRAEVLAATITDATARGQHVAAHRRLTHPQEMGSLFKVIALTRPGSPTPPGMDP